MSLDWNVGDVKGWAEAKAADRLDEDWFADGKPGAWQDVMIWSTLATAIGWKITEENLEEFRARIRTLEAFGQGVSVEPIPDEVIDAYVGLGTNVSRQETPLWLVRVFEHAHPKAKEDVHEGCGGPLFWVYRDQVDDDDEVSGMRQECTWCYQQTEKKAPYGAKFLLADSH